MNRNREIALSKLADIIGEFNLNSQITESVETGEPFIIIEEWSELGTIIEEFTSERLERVIKAVKEELE